MTRILLIGQDRATAEGLFDRVAPGARVAVTVPADAPMEARVALELAGFQVVSAPATPDDLLKPLS